MRRRINNRTRRLLWSVVGVLVVGYFLYHTLQGERGWFAMLRLQREIQHKEEVLSQVREERERLEHRTKLLRGDRLDPDILDEESRRQLNYSKPNEIVILTGTEQVQQKKKDETMLQRNK